jgi:hypothetical protein
VYKYDCKNHRGISLLSIPGKLYGRILIVRVQCGCQDVQCGFMPGRGFAGQIFTVQQVIEEYLEVKKKSMVSDPNVKRSNSNVKRSLFVFCRA